MKNLLQILKTENQRDKNYLKYNMIKSDDKSPIILKCDGKIVCISRNLYFENFYLGGTFSK